MFTFKPFISLLLMSWASADQTVSAFRPDRTDPRWVRSSIPVTVTHSGALYDGHHATFGVWLSAGTTYSIEAWCDGDCSDLDLALYSASGVRVAGDFADDPEPQIVFNPSYSSTGPNRRFYQVRVIMARCALEPCAYEAEVAP